MALRLGVLLSGSGSTLQNLIDRSAAGTLDAEITCVVSSRSGVYGLERARSHGIPALTVARKDFAKSDLAGFSAAVWQALEAHKVDLAVMAGFMCLLDIPDAWHGRVVNVHPALIPAFCGQGMYGRHVHDAVLAYGAKLTGATVHFVDNEYDHGPIIVQGAVPVDEDDTPDTLAERVQALERELYPQAIQLFAEGRLRIEGRRVRLLPKGEL
jgi:formyltetrahydrofolate-dependent phosphoribosylglycinamide formyltransferase